MSEFRALPVRHGDAFLLRSGRGTYLIDGGSLESAVSGLLRDRKIRRLRALICTAFTPERVGGLLDALASDIKIGECWLPESFGSLMKGALSFRGDWKSWNRGKRVVAGLNTTGGRMVEFAPEFNPLACAALLLGVGMTALGIDHVHSLPLPTEVAADGGDEALTDWYAQIFPILSARAVDRWQGGREAVATGLSTMAEGLLRGGGVHDLAFIAARMLLAESEDLTGCKFPEPRVVVRTLAHASMACALIARTNVRVRFFRSFQASAPHLVANHPFKCLNGCEVEWGEVRTGHLSDCLRKLAERERLVFQYGAVGCSVLFCGESSMSFLGPTGMLRTDRPSIITVPKYGSVAAEQAYERIKTNPRHDVWVRAHSGSVRKISSTYQHQPNKHCVTDCSVLTTREILLAFRRGEWTRLGEGTCACG